MSFLTSVFLQVMKLFIKIYGFTQSKSNKEAIRKNGYVNLSMV